MRLPSLLASAAFVAVAVALASACEERFPEELSASPPPPSTDAGEDAGEDAAPIVPKGARTLGVEVEIDSLELPSQVSALIDAGARTTNVPFTWDDVERPVDAGPDADGDAEAGTFVSNAGVHIVNLVLGTRGVRASFAVAAIDGTGPRLPADLAGLALDDPAVTSRYDAVTDYVFTQLVDLELDAYLVGIDVDASLGADAARWAAFAGFVSKVGAHARTKRKDLKVGFVMSAAALVERAGLSAAAVAASDVVVVSQPSSLEAIVAAAPPGKSIHVYRTSLRADDAFAEWDRNVDRVAIVTFPAVSADLVRAARARGF